MNNHEKYIQRCLDLAINAKGHVAPNPMVGCVIVYNDKIIGEGYHQAFGKAHAEVNAINNVKDKSLLNQSTLYVNLEPCAHHGKTPPCADLIIKHNIPNVIIGTVDIYNEVAGKGIEKLKNAGIHVKVDVLKDKCVALNKEFFVFHQKKRPLITLKWAQSRDGFVYNPTLKDNWITNDLNKQLVHQWRAHHKAILVGYNTVLNDNPYLTVRLVKGKNPLRIVFDKYLDLNKQFNIFNTDAETLILNYKSSHQDKNLTYLKVDSKNELNDLFAYCYHQGISSIFVEGGTKILQKFIAAGCWDEAFVFSGNRTFKEGLKAPVIQGTLVDTKTIGSDILNIYKNDSIKQL